MTGLRAAVFLDKDGTLVENVPYNVDPGRMRPASGVLAALRLLARLPLVCVVITNQPGVALGCFANAALEAVHVELARWFAAAGARLDGFFVCPHAPGTGCWCRKPAPGLLHQAAAALQLDLARSWCIGDILDDVEAGRRAGCRAILVDSGGETVWRRGAWRDPEWVVPDLRAAVEIVARSPAWPAGRSPAA